MTLILYLTTDCNLRCEYCYESNNRKELKTPLKLDLVSAYKQMQEAYSNKNEGNTIVLFGGEPLLEYNLMQQIFKINLVKFNNWFCFTINTNGLLLNKYIMEDINKYRKYMAISFNISYDGTGTDRRVYPNGKSAKMDILKSIALADSNNFSFGISYTIQKANSNIDTIINDIDKLFSTYHNLVKIELGYDIKEVLTSLNIDNIHDYTNELLNKLCDNVYNKYHKSICCNKYNSSNNTISPICAKCKKCNFIGDRVYVFDNKTISKKLHENDKEFNQWKK